MANLDQIMDYLADRHGGWTKAGTLTPSAVGSEVTAERLLSLIILTFSPTQKGSDYGDIRSNYRSLIRRIYH